MKKILILSVVLFLISIFAANCFILELFIFAHSSNEDNNRLKFIIENGASFNGVCNELKESDLITNNFMFRLIAVLYGYDSKIKAGEYYISKSMSPLTMLEIFVKGKSILYKITIPEGFSTEQIGQLLELNGLTSKEDFVNTANNINFAKKLGLNCSSFEGYLFPDTYYFPKGISCEKIITIMYKSFQNKIKPEWIKKASEMNFSLHKIITLASIIEKETGTPEERPIIASIFHNRLKNNMRLESDPTVIYGIKNFNGNITKKDLQTQTPYNTYKIKGLPPGPIANPGARSIHAAIFPDQTKYLYFVSKKDGTHFFSTNLKDHSKAVQKYQKN